MYQYTVGYYIYGNCTTRDVFSGSVTIILSSKCIYNTMVFFLFHYRLLPTEGNNSAPRFCRHNFLLVLYFLPSIPYRVTLTPRLLEIIDLFSAGRLGSAGGEGALTKTMRKSICSMSRNILV